MAMIDRIARRAVTLAASVIALVASTLAAAVIALVAAAAPAAAQQGAAAQQQPQGPQARIGDLTSANTEMPIRIVGYGLVVGLDGTGDRAIGSFGARHTVQSISNLLRNFDIEVPPEVLRTRNVAAVLVTAEASGFLRPGGRFDVNVSSIGDAQSLRGGVLWMTPLIYEAGGTPVATAQGPIVMSDGRTGRASYSVETSARVPEGGLLGADLPRASFASTSRLILREPSLGTAIRIAEAINGEAAGSARVEDPGSVAITIPADAAQEPALFLARIADLRIERAQRARLIVDGRDGTVVAGGDLVVGRAVVSHAGLTLTVGGADNGEPAPGEVRVTPGASVQDIAASLHAVGAPAAAIGAIFEALRAVGALTAEVSVR
jgi:flagellar P-ring protein precursor FlgI